LKLHQQFSNSKQACCAAQSRVNRLCTDIKGSAPGLLKASRFKSCEQLLKLIKYKNTAEGLKALPAAVFLS